MSSKFRQVVTPRDLPLVLYKFGAWMADAENNAPFKSDHSTETRAFCDALTTYLDELAAQDAFGTEGQIDPRGDHRD